MDAFVHGMPFEHTAREIPDVGGAYVAGYADGVTLLHLDGHDHSPAGPLQRIHARYLECVELEHPTADACAYMAGFRDAAADNLPCPPHEIGPNIRRDAE